MFPLRFIRPILSGCAAASAAASAIMISALRNIICDKDTPPPSIQDLRLPSLRRAQSSPSVPDSPSLFSSSSSSSASSSPSSPSPPLSMFPSVGIVSAFRNMICDTDFPLPSLGDLRSQSLREWRASSRRQSHSLHDLRSLSHREVDLNSLESLVDGVMVGNDSPRTPGSKPSCKRRRPHHTFNVHLDMDEIDQSANDVDYQLDLKGLAQENSRLWQIIDGHYVPANLQPAGMLDRRMAYVSDAVEQANLSSILFISRPLAAALTKGPFHIALLIISLFFFLEFSFELAVLSTSEWGFRSSTVRFVTTQLRNGQQADISHPHVKSFGLLHDSFAINTYNADLAVQNNTIVAHFAERMHATGFFIVTSHDSPDLDATHFHLEASDDDGQTWRLVAASASRFGFGGRMELIEGSARIPATRGEAVFFSLAPNWEVYVNGPLRSFLSTIFFALTAVLAHMGFPWAARSAFIAGFLCTVVLCFVVGFGYVARGQLTLSCVWWTEAIGNLIIPLSVVKFPQKLVLALFLLGIYYLVVMSVVILVVAGFAVSDMTYSLLAGSVMACTALLVIYVREYFLSRSRTTMLPDKQAYDQKWAALLEEEATRAALARLSATAHRIQAPLVHPARQYNRLPSSDAMRGEKKQLRRASSPRCSNSAQAVPGTAGTADLTNPVCSLDQLYSQAVALDLILREKVQSWAELGFFSMRPEHWQVHAASPGESGGAEARRSPSFVRWAEAREDAGLREKIKWGTVKSPERAIEKAVRTYVSDVSLLVDIVRQCIVFETVEDLCATLEGICTDADVRIVRVKNRMDPSYDSWSSAGYRDVSINLQVVTPETLRLGLENHVMEIQLVLLPFASLRQDAGHARYVAWRNERGC